MDKIRLEKDVKPIVKSQTQAPLSPSEEAVVVSMLAEGHAQKVVGEKVGKDQSQISRIKRKHEDQIAERRGEIYEDRLDDYSRIVCKTLARLEEKLDNDDKVTAKDLAYILKVIFDKRQLLIGAPISTFTYTPNQLQEFDALASKETFEANYKQLQQMIIDEAETTEAKEIEDGEVISE